MNKVTNLISSHFHLYADDLQLYRHFKIDDLVPVFDAINADLVSIHNGAKSFGLVLNSSKSQALLIGSRFLLNSSSNLPSHNLNILTLLSTIITLEKIWVWFSVLISHIGPI